MEQSNKGMRHHSFRDRLRSNVIILWIIKRACVSSLAYVSVCLRYQSRFLDGSQPVLPEVRVRVKVGVSLMFRSRGGVGE